MVYETLAFEQLRSGHIPEQCIGYAKSQDRKCRNIIAAANMTSAQGLVRRLRNVHDREIARPLMERLATLCLCTRWHRDQSTSIASRWLNQVFTMENGHVIANSSMVSSPSSSMSDSHFGTPSRPTETTPSTTPESSPSSEHVVPVSRFCEVQEHNRLLRAQVLTLQRTNADLQNTSNERDQLARRVNSLSRDVRHAERHAHRIASEAREEVETSVEQVAVLEDSNTLLRAQIIDLSNTLDQARSDLQAEKDTASTLRSQLDTEKARQAAAEQQKNELESRYTDLTQEHEAVVSSVKNMSAEIASERDRRRNAEESLDSTSEANSQLNSQIVKFSHEKALHAEQDQADAEAQAELQARQTRWNKYNICWTHFSSKLAQYLLRSL